MGYEHQLATKLRSRKYLYLNFLYIDNQ